MSHIIAVIPARFASTRLPGKPLLTIENVPLIVWVYRNVLTSGAFDAVYVATDNEQIATVVRDAGGDAVMTAAGHTSGTDRVFEVTQKQFCTHVVNVQGDEPQIPAAVLQEFVAALKQIDDNSLLTIVGHATIEDKVNPGVVKAVIDKRNNALYFSRAAIPFEREAGAPCYQHKGIYGFTAESIRRFCGFPRGELERVESLEQLRALENGMTIPCIIRDFESVGIDTPEDLELFRQRMVESNGN